MSFKYKIRDRVITLPDGHLLPQYQKQFQTYDNVFDPIYREIGRQTNRYFIDVGANVGDTAVVMRHNAANPIVSIEGGDDYLPILRENLAGVPDVQIIGAFVETRTTSSMAIQYKSQKGTGGFVAAPAGAAPTSAQSLQLRSILEQTGALAQGVAVFKTDTDGMDAYIVEDFLEIDSGQAALFFEFDAVVALDPGRAAAVWKTNFDVMRERGYSLLVFDNFGYQMVGCSPDAYWVLQQLTDYVREQFCRGSVHTYYFDVWAFPSGMKGIFEACNRRQFADFVAPQNALIQEPVGEAPPEPPRQPGVWERLRAALATFRGA